MGGAGWGERAGRAKDTVPAIGRGSMRTRRPGELVALALGAPNLARSSDDGIVWHDPVIALVDWVS